VPAAGLHGGCRGDCARRRVQAECATAAVLWRCCCSQCCHCMSHLAMLLLSRGSWMPKALPQQRLRGRQRLNFKSRLCILLCGSVVSTTTRPSSVTTSGSCCNQGLQHVGCGGRGCRWCPPHTWVVHAAQGTWTYGTPAEAVNIGVITTHGTMRKVWEQTTGEYVCPQGAGRCLHKPT